MQVVGKSNKKQKIGVIQRKPRNFSYMLKEAIHHIVQCANQVELLQRLNEFTVASSLELV